MEACSNVRMTTGALNVFAGRTLTMTMKVYDLRPPFRGPVPAPETIILRLGPHGTPL